MARFGLLIATNGKWANTQIVSQNFLKEATSTSQNTNNSYGYLWWLNEKPNYRLPQIQAELNRELIPNAPTNMYSDLGKNDQKIHIVPSKKLVVSEWENLQKTPILHCLILIMIYVNN